MIYLRSHVPHASKSENMRANTSFMVSNSCFTFLTWVTSFTWLDSEVFEISLENILARISVEKLKHHDLFKLADDSISAGVAGVMKCRVLSTFKWEKKTVLFIWFQYIIKQHCIINRNNIWIEKNMKESGLFSVWF